MYQRRTHSISSPIQNVTRIKIHYNYNDEGQQKTISFYMKFATISCFQDVKNKIENYLFNEGNFPKTTLRFYWFDPDDEEIQILNDDDVQFYLDKEFNNKYLWVKPKNFTSSRNNNNNNNNNNGENATHHGVECNNCLMYPIVGFRYKCVECPNYDICENCERKHAHAEHMMMRMPHNNCDGMLSSLVMTGCNSSRNKCPMRNDKVDADTAGASDTETTNNNDSGKNDSPKDRHRGSRRRRHRHGILSQVYEMMQSLAEGGEDMSSSKKAPKNIKNNTNTNGSNLATNIHEIAVKVARETANQAHRQIQEAAQIAAAAAATVAVNSLSENNNSMEDKTKAHKQSADKNAQESTNVDAATSAKVNKATEDKSDNIGDKSKFEKKSSAVSTAPLLPLETLLDPKFMKTGIQILNNFSDMFAKMLDPMETDVSPRETNQKNCPSPTSSNAPIFKSTNSSKSSSIEVLNSSTPKENLDANAALINDKHNEYQLEDVSDPEETDSSLSGSFIRLDVPNNEESNSTTKTDVQGTNTGDNNNNTKVELANESNGAQPKTYVADFAELRATLKAHASKESVDNGNNNNKANAIQASQSGTPTTTNNEKQTTIGLPEMDMRAVIVYHPDPSINTAIHQMMLMGFSNENGALTQLVESVNGNISEALDLISAAQ